MATVTNWIDHLSASEVAGQVYPMVGSEMWWVLAGIVFWLAWTVSTANGELKSKVVWLGKNTDQTTIKRILPSGNIIKY